MNLKERIIEVLAEQNHTYKQLAEFIGLSESDLDFSLQHENIDIRTLELVSKALRISLYSFFKVNGEESVELQKKIYFNLWSPNEIKMREEIESLKIEIKLLKKQLAEKVA